MPVNNQTPNADDVFGAQSSVPDADSVFGKDSSQEPSYSGSFADHMFGQGTLHKVGQAFMSDLSSGVQQANDTSKAIDDSLRKIGVYGQGNQKPTSMADTVKQTLQTYNEAFLRPTINGIVSTAIIDTSAIGATMSGAGALASAGAKEGLKEPSVASSPANVIAGGFGEIAQAMGKGEFFPEGILPEEGHVSPNEGTSPHIEPHFTSPVADTYTARAHGVVGEGEEGYFNTKPLSPENQAARDEYAREVGINTPKPGPVVKNPDELVPQIAPDLVKEYDEKLAYHDELAARLEELQPKESMGEEGIPSVVADKSPEYLAAQEAFKDNYLRLKELEPQIAEARAHAEELVGDNEEVEPGKTAEQPTTASEKPVQTEEEGNPDQSTKETEVPAQSVKSTYIADTVKQQLLNAGRPEDEAQAAGQLVQARYEARSNAFKGARGSAEDMFHETFPKIIKGEDTGTPRGDGKVLNQAVDQDRLRVARKMPDGSVKIGQPGDLHADLIDDNEIERSSVGHVGIQESDMGFATSDGEFLSREQAMDWVKKHQPEINSDIANGGSRHKDKLESTGYEKELNKAQLKENASSKLPPHLEEEPSFRTSSASIADEHAREVSSLESEGWKKFEDTNKKSPPYRAGQPVKAFHGTSVDFNLFDKNKQGKNKAWDAKDAMFFTDDPQVASDYANFDSISSKADSAHKEVPDMVRGVGANVRPVYLHLQKPKVIDYEGRKYSSTAFKRYISTAKEEGHDAVVFKNVDDGVLESSGKQSTVYALFNPRDQVTTRFGNTDTLYQSSDTVKPMFYSSLEKGVEKAGPNSGSADQWSKTIDNLTGVKKEEVEWSGVKDWLKDQKGPVSKNDIQEFLKENNVKIKEVEKSSKDTYDDIIPDRDTTKYPTVKLPGGKDYRELLLTLPNKTVRLSKDEYKEYSNLDHTEDRTPDQQKRYEELIAKDLDNLHKEEQQPTFQSSHWSEPNVLSHVRFDTRTGPNGEKILHIAEVQSDWHQTGRKEGYESADQTAEIEALKKKTDDLRTKVNSMLDREGNLGFDDKQSARNALLVNLNDWDLSPEDKQLAKDYVEARQVHLDAVHNSTRGVPDAPFKQTWQELSMKRMIRYAAENGFDKLSWDTGETNAKRARQLLTNVKEIQWNPDTKQFHLTLNNIHDHPNNNIRSLGLVEPNKLEGYIGRDATEALLNSEKNSDGFHTLAKDNLSVGGKGNRKFYDEILPGFMNKYVKKWGSSVKDDTVSTGDSDFHSAVAASDPDSDIWHLQDKETRKRLHGSPLFQNRLEAEQWLNKNKPPESSPAHSVDITPQMKDSVLNEGQPLFQNQKRGSLTIKEGRNVIRLFKDADASTFIHEVGHQWLEELQSDAEHPDAPDDIKRDTQVVRDWLGAEEGSPLSVAQHEKFARGFERYMREGNAPSAGLRGVFERFKTWLTQIYRTATQLRAPISDDIRQVFDRLLSPEESPENNVRQDESASPRNTSPNTETKDTQNPDSQPVSSGKRIPDVKGTGETRTAGLAQQLEDNARSSGLADTLGKLPDYKSLVMKDVWEKAAELVTDDPDRAKEVAMGNAAPPDGTTSVAVFKALSKDAMDRGDLQTIRDLAKSETPKTITKIAQTLRSAATEDDLDDPVSAIQAVQDAREKAMTKRLKGKNLDVERDKMAEEIRSNMQELQPSDFESFIRSIECDY